MHQQTQQNKKKKTKQKNISRHRNNTTQDQKIHQTQQQATSKKSLSTNLISSTAPWHQDVQSAVPIQQPYVEPLSLPPDKTLGGNDWGKSLVWGVGFFFCCLPNVATNKEWGISAASRQIRHESWGEKSGNAFFLVAERPSCTKTGGAEGAKRNPYLCLQKLEKWIYPFLFCRGFLEDFLWSLLSKGWPAFQVKVKFIPNSFHSKNVDQQKNVPGSKGPTFALWIFSKLMILLFNSLLRICWQLGWILYKSYQSYHLQNKWWVRWFLWSNITGGMTSQNYWDGKNGIIPLVTVAGRGIVVRSKPLYIEREVSHKN